MATKFGDAEDVDNHHVLPYSQSNAISDILYKELKKEVEKSHNYWIHEGRQLVFDH